MTVLAAAVRVSLASLLAWPAAGAAEPAKRLYSFTQQMGFIDGGAFVIDRHGVLFGTSSKGGAANEGTVFKFDPKTGVFAVIYSFLGGADGAQPAPGLALAKSGLLYGATEAGGGVQPRDGVQARPDYRRGVGST